MLTESHISHEQSNDPIDSHIRLCYFCCLIGIGHMVCTCRDMISQSRVVTHLIDLTGLVFVECVVVHVRWCFVPILLCVSCRCSINGTSWLLVSSSSPFGGRSGAGAVRIQDYLILTGGLTAGSIDNRQPTNQHKQMDGEPMDWWMSGCIDRSI